MMTVTKFSSPHDLAVITKADLKKIFALGPNDTGSPEVQIALLQRRISLLSEHLKKNRKDQSSYRGLRC